MYYFVMCDTESNVCNVIEFSIALFREKSENRLSPHEFIERSVVGYRTMKEEVTSTPLVIKFEPKDEEETALLQASLKPMLC